MSSYKVLTKGSQIDVKILSCGDHDVMTSLLIVSNGQRFLVNCGEGIQRILTEHKLKFGKIHRLFIPRLDWSYTGGLLGLSMTLRDTGRGTISIVGPNNFDQFIQSAKPFLNQESLKYEHITFTNGSLTFEDQPFDIDNFKYYDQMNDIQITVMNFGDIRGKFLIEKALELNIPKKFYRNLQQLQAITLENGTEILPEQVMEPSKLGPRIVLIDIIKLDNQADINIFNINDFIKNFKDRSIHIFHVSSPIIINNPIYNKLTKMICTECEYYQNIFVHPTLIDLSSTSVFEAQQLIHEKLHKIAPKIYPPIRTNHGLFQNSQMKFDYNNFTKVYFPSNFSTINIMTRSWDTPLGISDELLEEPPKKLKLSNENDTPTRRYPIFVFLGTGASLPSKYRNVSCILVRTSPDSSFLLDCGEGTFTQLLTHFDNNISNKATSIGIIKSIKFIYISHLHADHHLGTIRIIKAYNLYTHNQSPTIIGPAPLKRWLHYYSQSIETLYFDYIECTSPSLIHGFRIQQFPVLHSIPSFGVVIGVNNNEYKIVYSGDTYPCSTMVDYGKGAEYLIHEATFDDSMEEEATIKCHSTVTGALTIARLIECKCVFLTHFSQRYPKIAPTANLPIHTADGIENNFLKPQLIENINAYYSKILQNVDFKLTPITYRSSCYQSVVTKNPIIVCASDHMEVDDSTLELYSQKRDQIRNIFEELTD